MKKSMKGNKLLAFIIIVVLALSMCGCSGGSGSTSANVTIKTSTDKYTHYVKNYVGKNLATIGYTSWGGERFDKYGEGLLRIIPVTKSGEYIDIEDEEALQEYVVTDQSYAPNTEIKLTFDKDSDGEEYDNITAW